MHSASCQCGGLSLKAHSDPDFVIACNCKLCQRRTGSAFGVGGYFRKDTLEISGAPENWARTADSGREIVNHFCATCGTTLYWSLEMRPDHFGVAFGAFDHPLPEPARAIWTEAQHEWVHFPDAWPQFRQGTPE